MHWQSASGIRHPARQPLDSAGKSSLRAAPADPALPDPDIKNTDMNSVQEHFTLVGKTGHSLVPKQPFLIQSVKMSERKCRGFGELRVGKIIYQDGENRLGCH
jgi:hypothetical protein